MHRSLKRLYQGLYNFAMKTFKEWLELNEEEVTAFSDDEILGDLFYRYPNATLFRKCKDPRVIKSVALTKRNDKTGKNATGWQMGDKYCGKNLNDEDRKLIRSIRRRGEKHGAYKRKKMIKK